MRTIDLQTWSRRAHFKVYSNFDHPHFGLMMAWMFKT